MKMLKSVIFSILVLTSIVVCKPDYHFDKEVDGWLKLHVVPATWQQAFLNCHYEGAVLASPNNLQLATALRSIMRRPELELREMYIGTQATWSPGDYVSIEGVPLADMYVKWDTNPYADNADDTPGSCLRMSENGIVSPTQWDRRLPYVCYKKKDETSEVLSTCNTFDTDYYLHEATGQCYKLHKEKKSWFMAHKICAAEGGHLVIINDQREADSVTRLLTEIEDLANTQWVLAYIGLLDWNSDFTWLTIHGGKIENVYNKWARGKPDKRGINKCGSILRDGTLYNYECMTELMFICEKDPNTSRFELQYETEPPQDFTIADLP